MRKITPDLTPELQKKIAITDIALAKPVKVKTFTDLVCQIAELSYVNIDHLLFFRGQTNDYVTKGGRSTFYPNIYRNYSDKAELRNRFDILEATSQKLVDKLKENNVKGHEDVKKRKFIQWSILQHYEVCDTPLLDFTQSLRVACSFALRKTDKGIIFVFGLPYFTNRISHNSEHETVNVRLLSICPPDARRPYFQEGYLVGTEDVTWNYNKKNELDFVNRLICKFEIEKDGFWNGGNHPIPEDSLFPTDDPILSLCNELKEAVRLELRSGDIGEFLKSWSEIEQSFVNVATKETKRFVTIGEALDYFVKSGRMDKELMLQLDNLRRFRNRIVHTPKRIKQPELDEYMTLLELVVNVIKSNGGLWKSGRK